MAIQTATTPVAPEATEPTKNTSSSPAGGSRDVLVARIIVYGLLLAGVAIVMVPFLWMISTSLKNEQELFTFPPEWIPNPIQWGNYKDAWQALPFDRFLINTLFTTILAMFAEITTAAIVAYGFARFRFPG